MAGRECYHCKQWIEEGEAHDCWTTTEAALTDDLSEDLRDAWERRREDGAAVGGHGGRAAGGAGPAPRDRRALRRPADLRVGHRDHVLATVLLFLRAPEKELPAGLRVP